MKRYVRTVLQVHATAYEDSDAMATAMLERVDSMEDWWNLTPAYSVRLKGWTWRVSDPSGTIFGYLKEMDDE